MGASAVACSHREFQTLSETHNTISDQTLEDQSEPSGPATDTQFVDMCHLRSLYDVEEPGVGSWCDALWHNTDTATSISDTERGPRHWFDPRARDSPEGPPAACARDAQLEFSPRSRWSDSTWELDSERGSDKVLDDPRQPQPLKVDPDDYNAERHGGSPEASGPANGTVHEMVAFFEAGASAGHWQTGHAGPCGGARKRSLVPRPNRDGDLPRSPSLELDPRDPLLQRPPPMQLPSDSGSDTAVPVPHPGAPPSVSPVSRASTPSARATSGPRDSGATSEAAQNPPGRTGTPSSLDPVSLEVLPVELVEPNAGLAEAPHLPKAEGLGAATPVDTIPDSPLSEIGTLQDIERILKDQRQLQALAAEVHLWHSGGAAKTT